MAEIAPFRGILYKPSPAAGTDVSALIAPPYDVISDREQKELEGKSPHNSVKLILPKDRQGGTTDERYEVAAVLGGGLLFGRSFIAIMFDQMFNLTPKGWRLLTIRWMFFFAGMAMLNEIIWRTQSTDFWVSFKAFGVIPITAVFAMLQTSLIKRYSIEPATDEASDVERGDITKS